MSGPVIIRLQNLPMEARSIDIRRFFEGLVIPDGGVHIIGGEKGDAFIAFQSDEDARQAMARDSYLLCNSKIKLYLSSKTEMQNVISSARNPQVPVVAAPKHPTSEDIHLYKTSTAPQIPNQPTPSIMMSHQTQSYAPPSNNNNSMDLLSSLTKLIGNKNPTPAAPEVSRENNSSNIYEQMKNFSSWFPNAPKPSEPVKQQDPNEGLGLLKKAPQQSIPPLFTDTLMKTSPKNIVSPAESKPVSSHAFLSMPPPPIGLSHSQSQIQQAPIQQPQQAPQPAAQPKISIDQILSLLQNHIPSANQQNTNTNSNSSLASVIAALPSILSESKVQPQQNPQPQQTHIPLQQPPQLQQPPPTMQTNLPPPSLSQPSNIYTMPPPNLPPTSLPPPNYPPPQTQYQTEQKPSSHSNNPPPSQSTNNYSRDYYNNSNSYKTASTYNSNDSNGYNSNNNNNSYQSTRDEERKSSYKTNESSSSSNGSRSGYGSNNNNNNTNNNKHETRSFTGDSRGSRNDSYGNGRSSSTSSSTSNKFSGGSYQDPKSTYQPRTNLDPVIKVKNFNSNCSYKDVRTFLQGIQIEHDGIKLLTDHSTHQRNGSAYVKLVTITDLKKALCRNGQFYMEKSIEVSQSSESDFTGATNVYVPNIIKAQQAGLINGDQQPKFINKRTEPVEVKKAPELNSNDGHFLKIYGLPLKFDEGSLKSMFNNVKFVRILTSAPTPITSTNNGTQEATTTLKAKKLCQVETQLDLERALTRQDERVGKSKLQIFQISRNEFDRELNNLSRLTALADIGEDISDDYESDNDNCLLMTGVPFSAREADVRGFFGGLHVSSVHLIQDTQTQKPTGECYCQFATRNDRDRALERDDQLFRNRVVKIKPFSLTEFGQLMSNLGQLKQLRNNERGKSETGRPALLQTPNSPADRPKLLSGTDYAEYDEADYDSSSENSNGVSSRNNYKSNTSNYQTRSSRDEYQSQNNRYQGYQQNTAMKRRANGSSPTNIPSSQTGNNKRTKSNYYGDNGSLIPSLMLEAAPQTLPPLPPELQKYRDRLLLLSNVSYEASREDILDLVKTYSPLEHTLKIRHDDSGQPTGDAVVACKEPLDAADAADELNGIIFMDRQISANLFSS